MKKVRLITQSNKTVSETEMPNFKIIPLIAVWGGRTFLLHAVCDDLVTYQEEFGIFFGTEPPPTPQQLPLQD